MDRERLAAVAKGGVVMVTWANHHYRDFAINWLNHLHQLSITSYMIGAMDNELLRVGFAPAFPSSKIRPSWA